MNRTKSRERSKLSNNSLNFLMRISVNGPSLEEFDPQPAVTYWSRQCQRRPSFRKEKHFPTDEDESESELEMSDIEILEQDTDGELSLSNEDNESSDITI